MGGIIAGTHGTRDHARIAQRTQGHLLAHWVTSQHQVYACTCAFMQGEKQGTYGPPPVLAIRQEGWTYYLTESGLSCPAPHSFNGLGGAAEGRWRDI